MTIHTGAGISPDVRVGRARARQPFVSRPAPRLLHTQPNRGERNHTSRDASIGRPGPTQQRCAMDSQGIFRQGRGVPTKTPPSAILPGCTLHLWGPQLHRARVADSMTDYAAQTGAARRYAMLLAAPVKI